MNILVLVFFVALLSVAVNILGLGVVRRLRNALEHTARQSNEARGTVVLLRGEVRLLDEALARRDQTVAAVTRELQALRSTLDEPTPSRPPARVEALDALEGLARGGYGPTFTQCAVHAGGEVHTFGPGGEAFASAILRTAGAARLHVRERIAATDAARVFRAPT